MAKIDQCLRGIDAAADLQKSDPASARPLAARSDEVLDLVLRGVDTCMQQAEMLSRRVDRADRGRK